MTAGSAKRHARLLTFFVFLLAGAAALALVLQSCRGTSTAKPELQKESARQEIAGLIDALRTADPFIESDFARRAGRNANRLLHAGKPAMDMVSQAAASEEDDFARARLNAVLACARWGFGPYFIFELDPNFVGELYTREAPPKGDWLPSLETFLEARDAPKLVKAFTLNDPHASYYIFDFIEKLAPDALKPLLEALTDKHPYFHFCVTVAIMRLAPHTLTELRELAGDDNPDIRDRAVWALGLSGSSDAVGPLTEALKDEEASVRSSAAYMLAMIPKNSAVEHLIPALEDTDDDVAVMCANALGVIGDDAATEALQAYVRSGKEDAKRWGTSALAGIGPSCAGLLVSLLRDPDEETRLRAANALAELRGKTTIPELTAAASAAEKSPAVRAAAADALGYIGGKRAAEVLMKTLRDSDPEVRSSSAYALGRMRFTRAADSLAGLLEDDDARVRMAAISSLAKLGGTRVLDILVESLSNPELSPLAATGIKSYGASAGPALTEAFQKMPAQAKCTIARLLAEAGIADGVPALIDGLADADINVRFCSDKALRIITGHETSYKCDAPLAERAKGQEEWRKWRKENDSQKQEQDR